MYPLRTSVTPFANRPKTKPQFRPDQNLIMNNFAAGELVTDRTQTLKTLNIHPNIRPVKSVNWRYCSVIYRGSSLDGTSPSVLDRGKSIRSPSRNFTCPSPQPTDNDRYGEVQTDVLIQSVLPAFSSPQMCLMLLLTAQGEGFSVSRWGT